MTVATSIGEAVGTWDLSCFPDQKIVPAELSPPLLPNPGMCYYPVLEILFLSSVPPMGP